MLINIFDLNKKVDLNKKNQKNHDFFKKVMIFASPVFNRLPIHIRNISACSIDRFKSQLDRYLRTIPDLPSQPGYNNSLDGGDGIQRWTLRDGLADE